MIVWWCVLSALCAFVISATLTGLVRRYALQASMLDIPNDRSSHSVPTPRGGGVGILAAIAATLSVLAVADLVPVPLTLALVIGSIALGYVGWLDDRQGLSPKWRLLAHLAVAAFAVVLLGGLPGKIGAILTVLGIAWSINLFNFMDGIDGIAATEAILVLFAAALAGWLVGDAVLPRVEVLIAFGVLGFLLFNWPPAKIFMGDVGSGTLGYVIAVIALASERAGKVSLLSFGLFGAAFVGDATLTLLLRLARGEKPWEAHRSHAYQRLARAWESHRASTLAYAAFTIWTSILGIVAAMRPELATYMLIAGIASVIAGYVLVLRKTGAG